jgi:hypothetical protein
VKHLRSVYVFECYISLEYAEKMILLLKIIISKKRDGGDKKGIAGIGINKGIKRDRDRNGIKMDRDRKRDKNGIGIEKGIKGGWDFHPYPSMALNFSSLSPLYPSWFILSIPIRYRLYLLEAWSGIQF